MSLQWKGKNVLDHHVNVMREEFQLQNAFKAPFLWEL